MPNSKPADLTLDSDPVDPALVLLAQTPTGSADYKVAIGDLPVSTPQQTALDDLSTALIAATIPLSQKAVANGVASLDANGKVPVTQVPQSAFSSVDVVASQAAMLALSSAVEGSLAVRTDTQESYVLNTTPPSVLGNWVLFTSTGGADKQPLDADLTALAAAGNSAVLAAVTAAFTTALKATVDAAITGTMGGTVTREYSGSAWPARGTLPSGTVVLWVNRYNDTPPALGGSGYVDDVDVILLMVDA